MNWLKSLFTRTTRTPAPSGSLAVSAVRSIAEGLTYNVAASHGQSWLVYSVLNTNSMLPLFDSNAVMLAEACQFESLRPGDIVTYFSRGLVVHRLGEKDRNGHFVVSGDNNAVNDGARVSPENFDRRICGILYGAKDATTDT